VNCADAAVAIIDSIAPIAEIRFIASSPFATLFFQGRFLNLGTSTAEHLYAVFIERAD
jgi:hypothetical protein